MPQAFKLSAFQPFSFIALKNKARKLEAKIGELECHKPSSSQPSSLKAFTNNGKFR